MPGMAAAEAAVQRIEELAEEWPGHLELIDALRAQYGHRASHIEMHHGDAPLDEAEQELLEHRQIRGGGHRRRARGPHPDARAGRASATMSSGGSSATSTSRSSGWRPDERSG